MLRVLLVDDELPTLEMMTALFTSWGYTVNTALTGQAAIASVKMNCPQVVISDLIMPGMSGLELLQAIRTEGCPVFFVMLTGYGTVPRGVAAIEEGADEVMLKPLDIEVLHATLKERGLLPESSNDNNFHNKGAQ